MREDKRYDAHGVTLKIEAKTHRVLYEYRAGDMRFSFDLLSHVGQPWQRSFRRLISNLDIKIELYDNPNDTYKGGYYERVANT
jgi:hypothetical protein